MPRYKYEGPIYRNGRKVDSHWVEYTTAKSKVEAKRNLQFRLGLGYQIFLDHIEELGPTWEEEHPDRVCPDCGNLLMDSGKCPLCDDYDYSIVDEIKLMKDIDDGNYSDY